MTLGLQTIIWVDRSLAFSISHLERADSKMVGADSQKNEYVTYDEKESELNCMHNFRA